MTEALLRTPLYAAHLEAGGQMVPFAGWEMPVQYAGRGLVVEHEATRNACGLFDVSHMGEIVIEGPGAEAEVDHLVTNDASRLSTGDAMYALLCHPSGGTVDDLFVYRLGADRFLIVVNASNKDKDFAHMRKLAKNPRLIHDRSSDFAQIALQGPKAKDILPLVAPGEAIGEKRNQIRVHAYRGADLLVATTGYTGEPGFELYCPPEIALDLWHSLLDAGKAFGISPVGLGARDTLRLEMGYALYGHELDDETNAYEAKVGWAVKLQKGPFVGSEVLAAAKGALKKKLVGLKMLDRGIAREGYEVLHEGRVVGKVTSGTQSPTLKQAIALAYVTPELASNGSIVEVALRGGNRRAEVCSYPFVRTGLTA